MKIPQSLREVIEKGPYAHLTTLNRDGSPQVTVVWVGIEGEEFVIGHLATHQKVKNIRRVRGSRCLCSATRPTRRGCGNTWWLTATRG
jgi:predicted pyridoxine 5'-phosphate oxidase superfamily flavin-nucleotide-binding protein